MSTYENPLTPDTCVGSDDGTGVSTEAAHRGGGWRGTGLKKHPSQHPSLIRFAPQTSEARRRSSTGDGVGDSEVKKRPKSSNVIRRAIHKITKKKKARNSLSPSAEDHPTSAVETAAAPPKIEELGIDPRLLEKWMARKELRKQGVVAGDKPDTTRTATLVMKGLSSGSLAWTTDRIRSWSRANGVVLAALIVAAAVAIACALVLRRCS